MHTCGSEAAAAAAAAVEPVEQRFPHGKAPAAYHKEEEETHRTSRAYVNGGHRLQIQYQLTPPITRRRCDSLLARRLTTNTAPLFSSINKKIDELSNSKEVSTYIKFWD